MYFASDNAAGVAPAILDALQRANASFALGYGQDEATKRLERRFSELFEREVAVFLVSTGTAANALALAHVSPPWGAVICHGEAHIAKDECGAPEFFGGGLKLVGLAGEGCKITASALAQTLERTAWGGPHHVTPAVLSLTQATEAGTVYQPNEIADLAALARSRGIAVHMDGARFANALVRLGLTAAEATWKAGVDVLSFGATKGGAMAAEAVVFFDSARAASMPERRKRGGHLISKHRFLAVQMEAFLTDDLWLTLARHANDMADRLAKRLSAIGLMPVWPVEANLVFSVISCEAHDRLQAAGAQYYAMQSNSLPESVKIASDSLLIRLVTSFSTTEADIDRFVVIAQG
jgi:threonine aldolase